MTYYDENWKIIFNKAQSTDVFDRLASLTRSIFFLELALIAIGTKHRKHAGVTALLNNSELVKEKYDPEFIIAIQKVIYARNDAVHKGILPGPRVCLRNAVKIFGVCSWMRSKFITQQTAADFSQKILMSNIFHEAFLFGSLARNPSSKPGDIDLLLFDNGEISYLGETYGEQRSVQRRRMLKKAHVEDDAYIAALDLDWIDLVVVHHKDFIDNADYIRNIASTQSPYFLLNITEGIKKYDKTTGQWLDCNDLPFKRWKKIRRALVREGILSEQ